MTTTVYRRETKLIRRVGLQDSKIQNTKKVLKLLSLIFCKKQDVLPSIVVVSFTWRWMDVNYIQIVKIKATIFPLSNQINRFNILILFDLLTIKYQNFNVKNAKCIKKFMLVKIRKKNLHNFKTIFSRNLHPIFLDNVADLFFLKCTFWRFSIS